MENEFNVLTGKMIIKTKNENDMWNYISYKGWFRHRLWMLKKENKRKCELLSCLTFPVRSLIFLQCYYINKNVDDTGRICLWINIHFDFDDYILNFAFKKDIHKSKQLEIVYKYKWSLSNVP